MKFDLDIPIPQRVAFSANRKDSPLLFRCIFCLLLVATLPPLARWSQGAALADDTTGKAADIQKFRQALFSVNQDDVKSAAIALGKLGPAAKESVPDLLSAAEFALTQRSTEARHAREACYKALVAIGPNSVEPVLKSWKGLEVNGRVQMLLQVIRPLHATGDNRIEKFLREGLDDSEIRVRLAAVSAVSSAKIVSLLPRFVEILKNDSESEDVRSMAAFHLADFGDEARSTRTLLEKLVHDPKTPVEIRRSALSSFGEFGFQSSEEASRVAAILDDQGADGRFRADAARALGSNRTYGKPSMESLIRTLKKSKPGAEDSLRRPVIEAIGRLGPTKEAIPCLMDVVEKVNEDMGIRLTVVRAFCRGGPDAKLAKKRLIPALRAQDSELLSQILFWEKARNEQEAPIWYESLVGVLGPDDLRRVLDEFLRSPGTKETREGALRILRRLHSRY